MTCENLIKEAAYYNWQNAGCPNGQDEYFWNMAIEQYSSCSNKKSCSTKTATKKKTSTTAKKATSTKTTRAKKIA